MNVGNVARTETEYQFDHIIKLASGHPTNADDLAEVATLQDQFVISGTGTRQCVVPDSRQRVTRRCGDHILGPKCRDTRYRLDIWATGLDPTDYLVGGDGGDYCPGNDHPTEMTK